MSRLFFLLSIISLGSACQTDVVYENTIPINVYGWNMADTLKFNLKIEDSAERYDLSLSVRHRDIYDYTNLYVKVISRLPNGEIKSEVVSLPLCDEAGKWLGKCAGDICFSRILLMKRTYYPIKGEYQFYVIHEMRQEKLRNLLDIGLRLEKSIKKVYLDEEV